MTAYALVKDTNHVAEALALLTGQFSSDLKTPNIRNLVRVMANRTQDVENTIWDVINSQLIALTPTGQALNQLGDLIGEPRGGFNDAQYLLWIKVAIRARSSAGRSEDAIQIAALGLGAGAATYTDYPPAAYAVLALNIFGDYAAPLGQALSLARPLGVRGVLDWSNWPTSQNIVLTDSTSGDTVPTPRGFADAISGQFPYELIGAIQL